MPTVAHHLAGRARDVRATCARILKASQRRAPLHRWHLVVRLSASSELDAERETWLTRAFELAE
jgi:hypothetical protein